jgi:hypothetical protein
MIRALSFNFLNRERPRDSQSSGRFERMQKGISRLPAVVKVREQLAIDFNSNLAWSRFENNRAGDCHTLARQPKQKENSHSQEGPLRYWTIHRLTSHLDIGFRRNHDALWERRLERQTCVPNLRLG